MQLLVATAGAILWATILSGWLNGQGLAFREDFSRLALRREIAGEDLAVIPNTKLARQREHVVSAADLVKRILLGDAKLQRDDIGKLVPPGDKPLRRAQEYLLSVISTELGAVARGNLEGPYRMLSLARRHRADHRVGKGITDFDNVVGIDLFPGNAHGFVAWLGCPDFG
jgi:hypothetical protein